MGPAKRERADRLLVARDLAEDRARAHLPLDARTIITRYHDLVLGGRAVTVEVGERFRIEATLAPVLDEAKRTQLPPREIQDLSLGQSALIDRATTELDIEFRIQGRHYELLE